MTKLTLDEIDRQAADRSHLAPDPVACLKSRCVCMACGEEFEFQGHNQDDRVAKLFLRCLADFDAWYLRHRRGACQRQTGSVRAFRGGKEAKG